MPTPQHNSPNRQGVRSLAAVLDPRKAGRLTLKGNYEEPKLPFAKRMAWLAKVQRLTADYTRERKSYPHKVMAVARVIAQIGDVCRLSFDSMAERAGCVPNTAQACVAWLEENGALTWNRTARMHRNGRMVRSSNLYKLIECFNGLAATMARVIRSIWRDRPSLSNSNQCHGMPQLFTYQEQKAAEEALRTYRESRANVLAELWQGQRVL